MVELKAPESDAFSDPELELDKGNDKGKQIIDADPSAIVANTKLHREDTEDPEEGDFLFHSQMWVKGFPMKFLVDRRSEEPHFNRPREVAQLSDHNTPTTI